MPHAQGIEVEQALREQDVVEAYDQHTMLANVTHGLYAEVAALAHVWPRMVATERTIKRVNQCLAAVQELLHRGYDPDPFLDGLGAVPSDDPPEYRDLVLILREARDGLERFKTYHAGAWSLLGFPQD